MGIETTREQDSPNYVLSAPPSCGAGDALSDARCALRAGHEGPHWGHGPIRQWTVCGGPQHFEPTGAGVAASARLPAVSENG